MDTQLLTAFIEVADSQSFTRAADVLHLSQPAVSKRITALEDQIGRPLFDRVGRNISLTDAGHTLLPYARKVLQDIEDGRRALSQLEGHVSGRLSIGTSHHIGLHRLPPVLGAYTRDYPQVDLDIHFMDSEVACDAVLAGKLELGIVTLPLQSLPHLQSRAVWPDPLTVVCAASHPLAQSRKTSLKQLAEHPAVLPDAATYTHRIITEAFKARGVAPRVRLATNYLETLKMLVSIGLGWSVLPDSMIDDSLIRLQIPGLAMSRQLGMVWHERRTLSGAAQALMQLMQQA
ncbi:LysR family transcriptional regulator [Polycyclovorans algicola]|uniref:LysR family transcriptional regulator n=1 Tax=Polycyclovorans algicola TaxID=616992 RepID=UPI0004A762EE|nr:LysR family transcriptional regulator [Polycyclovorans algicola]